MKINVDMEMAKAFEYHYRIKYKRMYRRRLAVVSVILLWCSLIIISMIQGWHSLQLDMLKLELDSLVAPITQQAPIEVINLDEQPPAQLFYDLIEIESVETPLALPVGANGEFKTYMDYRTITNKKSKQWALQQVSATDDKGFRKFNDSYLVAVGTYYSNQVGKELLITLDTGKQISVIVGDVKQDAHTDAGRQYVPKNGNILEFIVDTKLLDARAKKLGNVSCLDLDGKIVAISEIGGK